MAELSYTSVELIPSIGLSVEKRPIQAVRMGSPLANMSVLVLAGLHAREWIATAAVLTAMKEFITNATMAPILDQIQILWLPMTNPDGYEFSHTSNRMWRKNRRGNPNSECMGVDLNRNFPFHWGEADSSVDPCAQTYRGMFAASEPEVRAIMNFIKEEKKVRQIVGGIDFHTYGQLILTQPGWTKPGTSADDVPESLKLEMSTLGNKMVSAIQARTGAVYHVKPGSEMYKVGGSFDSVLYEETSTGLGFAVELRDHEIGGSFILNESEIRPTSEDVVEILLVLLNHILENYIEIPANVE